MNDKAEDIKKEDIENNKPIDAESIIHTSINDNIPKITKVNNHKSRDNFNLLLQKKDWKRQLRKPYKKK